MDDESESTGGGKSESSGEFCHISLDTISRGKGRSATGAAAYRSASKITDTRNRRRCRERPRRRAAMEAAAYARGARLPTRTRTAWSMTTGASRALKRFSSCCPGAPWEYMDRSTLWNAQEDAEVKCNAVVAREFDMALPCDLPEDEQWGICTDMGQWLIDRYGVAVDIALHAPAAGEGHDQRNDHCHIMFTSRVVTHEGFGEKVSILNERYGRGPQEVVALRQAYADFCNVRLEKYGLPYRLDPRTLEAQGIDRIPQIHVGPNGWAMYDGNKNPASHTRTDSQGRVIEWEKIDGGESRAEFCDRIKATNKRRAQFGPVPLHVQIDNIGQYIDLMIGKVAELKALIPPNMLPLWLRARYEAARYRLLEIAEAVFLENREAEERRIRRGREEGIHARMKRMNDEIEQLQRDRERKHALQRLYTRIEHIVASRPPVPVVIERPPTRILSFEQYRVELVAKAETARARVPPEYRPRLAVPDVIWDSVADRHDEGSLGYHFHTGPPATNGGLAEPPPPIAPTFNEAAGIAPEQAYKTKVNISFGVA